MGCMNTRDKYELEVIPNVIRLAVGQEIRAARTEAGMSQAELAARLDRRQAYVSELERGKTEPSMSLLVLLSRILGKSVISFIPPQWRDPSGREQLSKGELSTEELELLRTIREVQPAFRYHLAIHLVKALSAYDVMVESILNDSAN